MNSRFTLKAPFLPAGDQPAAIAALRHGFEQGNRFQILEGVTGSGKTFTMAHVMAMRDQPVLVISHNKTLAAQLFRELQTFFPDHAVEFFISYYDYYQPEAYIPQTDTFIEKDASINPEIERLRLSATNALLSRRDVIIVASVSCIYGLGSPEDYAAMVVRISRGETVERDAMLSRLVDIQYTRNDYDPQPGMFRVRGDVVDIIPSYAKQAVRVEFFGDQVEGLWMTDPLTGSILHGLETACLSPAKHFVMPAEKIAPAAERIRTELRERVAWFEANGKLLEAQRIQQRTLYDLEMLVSLGYCPGVENYSRHLSGRAEGVPPASLLNYFPEPFLTIIDESHVSVPQLRAMYQGDQSRKQTLVEHGFRLPSARDNRPLNFDEFMRTVGPVLFVSATPGPYERSVSPPAVPQVIRPTGLLDPPVTVRPLTGQIDDVMAEIRSHAEREERVLVTTLTKRTAEDLCRYLSDMGVRAEYLHSDIDALERVTILRRLRKGEFDCLIGINLLREGLDLPEVALVAILDADKEGFLRSETSLMQVAGRTARHVDGKVILYADQITESMRRMIETTKVRREIQTAYNQQHGIVPRTIVKEVRDGFIAQPGGGLSGIQVVKESSDEADLLEMIRELEAEMIEAADHLEYERAADLRDQVKELKRHIASNAAPALRDSSSSIQNRVKKPGTFQYPSVSRSQRSRKSKTNSR